MNWRNVIRVIGLGAGGHAKVVIEILRLIEGYELVGLLDPKQELWGAEVLDLPILGDDSLISRLCSQGIGHAFIGLGTVGDTNPRRKLYEKACDSGLEIVNAVHPQATISRSAKIGQGVTVMADAVINADARLGENVIVNTGAIVEHDCIIGDHVHIATGARLGSTVQVGEGSHIGMSACVRQGITIGPNSIVGAGAVVVDDVPEGVVVVGVPAAILRRLEV